MEIAIVKSAILLKPATVLIFLETKVHRVLIFLETKVHQPTSQANTKAPGRPLT